MDYAYKAYSEYVKKCSLTADMGLDALQAELNRFWDGIMISVSQSTSDTHIRNAYRMLVQQARTQSISFGWLDAPAAYYSAAASTKGKPRLPWIGFVAVFILALTVAWFAVPHKGQNIPLACILGGALVLSVIQFFVFTVSVQNPPSSDIRTEQRISPDRVRSGLLRIVREVDGHAESLNAILNESAPIDQDVDLSLVQELMRLPEHKRGAEITDAVERYLVRNGVEQVTYSPERQELFVQLPAEQTWTVEPALVKDGRLLHMGVACVASEE